MLAQRLRTLRLEHKLTQQDLADILGLERTAYTYYETGKTTPSPASLCKIARVYRVTVGYLLGVEANHPERLLEEPVFALRAPIDPIAQLPKDERRLLAHYRALDDAEKKKAMRSMQRRFEKLLNDEKKQFQITEE